MTTSLPPLLSLHIKYILRYLRSPHSISDLEKAFPPPHNSTFIMVSSNLKPPHVDGVEVSFPTSNILLITLSRPKQMNSINHTMNWQLQQLFDWFDNTPSLRVAVITGTGPKAFCCGSDLIEIESARNAKLSTDDLTKSQPYLHDHPRSGFAGFSRRRGKKPVLAAVNGLALGGGFEVVLNR